MTTLARLTRLPSLFTIHARARVASPRPSLFSQLPSVRPPPPRFSIRAMATSGAHDESAAAAKAAAEGAAALADAGGPTIFDKIIAREIPATIIYEDDAALAFRDVNPQAPTHFLVIPKVRAGLTQLVKATPAHEPLLGHLLAVATTVAKQEGIGESGYRVVINDGADGCQSVFHLHLHVMGGRKLAWPPG